MSQYTEKDFVTVVEGEGDDAVETRIPKAWVDTDFMPPGAKVKKGRSGGSSTKTEPPADGVPAKSETREVLEAYAVDKGGLTEDEAKAFANKDELHAELVKRASDNG